MISKLENYLEKLDKRGYINGSALVSYQGDILLNKGYGIANIDTEFLIRHKLSFLLAL